jgi:hypothetical protein
VPFYKPTDFACFSSLVTAFSVPSGNRRPQKSGLCASRRYLYDNVCIREIADRKEHGSAPANRGIFAARSRRVFDEHERLLFVIE